jgi:2-keto-4-pentenoate hydratase
MPTTDTPRLAQRLWAARRDGVAIEIADADIPADEAASYAIQAAAIAASGMARIGWKIGSTSAEAQKLLGTSGPGASPMLAPYCYDDGADIPIFPAHKPGLEGEFALRFARDLPPRATPYASEEVLDAIDAIAPALEIVGARRVGGLFGQGRLLVNADFGANIAFAHGAWVENWRAHDLAAAPVRLSINGVLKAEGTGARALGSPLNVAVWLANNLSERGIGIRAGEVASTGTCTGVIQTQPGETIRLDFAALGALTVRMTAG